MHTSSQTCLEADVSLEERTVLQAFDHALHYLPSQGPISVFVHHNTLHAFESYAFDDAVMLAHQEFQGEPYLSEKRYHAEIHAGRITKRDVEESLLRDLGSDADELIAMFGTRYALRLAMLQHSIATASGSSLHWILSETDALNAFRSDVPVERRRHAIETTKVWATSSTVPSERSLLREAAEKLGDVTTSKWSQTTWEKYYLTLLWIICRNSVANCKRRHRAARHVVRPRDLVLKQTGRDADRLVNERLIRFCANFTDQGFAAWSLPDEHLGFAKSFAALHAQGLGMRPQWLQGALNELREVSSTTWRPVDSIIHSLRAMEVPPPQWEDAIKSTMLALPGWAGMLWQMETNAPWLPKPAKPNTTLEFLAIRLILDRAAAEHLSSTAQGAVQARTESSDIDSMRSSDTDELAFLLFQLAQIRCWEAKELAQMSPNEWQLLVDEVEAFDSFARRRVLHAAYERNYRVNALNAIAVHGIQRLHAITDHHDRPSYQVVMCIDDREESFRRHLEEIAPECETYGAPGFFAAAMYYRSVKEAFYRPLCPINITPLHYVRESPLFSSQEVSTRRERRRQLLGKVLHSVHTWSRTMLGGVITAILGSIASVPMVTRILLPRSTANFRLLGRSMIDPPATELLLERESNAPSNSELGLGFSVEEMAAIVVRVLQDIGMTKTFAPIVLFVGHGSSSLNNPHESAYNCGACSGGRGGPNARAVAWMANEPRVRRLVSDRGISIPDDVCFIGAYHNTCNDDIEYFDLDNLSRKQRDLFRQMERDIDKARARNAKERARRFFSVPLDSSADLSLTMVEQRSEDLSQARPEYNHATNAMCYVGRREWTRGLFMDRRSFLVSYDPQQDDEQSTVLARILAAAIPVCGGISLEYYFSTVDTECYGCGSKLPHNIAGLVGVMTGAASDLRPGLSAQMVEIHEPMRILFVIETSPERMTAIMERNSTIETLVRNQWVQIACLDIQTGSYQLYDQGAFQHYEPPFSPLPQASSSVEWFTDSRDPLGFASITSTSKSAETAEVGQ